MYFLYIKLRITSFCKLQRSSIDNLLINRHKKAPLLERTIAGCEKLALYDNPVGVTVAVYCEQLERLKATIAEKHHILINRKSVILQYNDVRLHAMRIIIQKD